MATASPLLPAMFMSHIQSTAWLPTNDFLKTVEPYSRSWLEQPASGGQIIDGVLEASKKDVNWHVLEFQLLSVQIDSFTNLLQLLCFAIYIRRRYGAECYSTDDILEQVGWEFAKMKRS